MPETPAAGGARSALHFTGDVGKGQSLPNVPAQDLTLEQTRVWFTDEQYAAILASGFYTRVADSAVDASKLGVPRGGRPPTPVAGTAPAGQEGT